MKNKARVSCEQLSYTGLSHTSSEVLVNKVSGHYMDLRAVSGSHFGDPRNSDCESVVCLVVRLPTALNAERRACLGSAVARRVLTFQG